MFMFINSIALFASSLLILENQSGVFACAPKANASDPLEHLVEKRSSNQIEVLLLSPLAYDPASSSISSQLLEAKIKAFAQQIGNPIPSSGYQFEAVDFGGKLAARVLIDESVESCSNVIELVKELKLNYSRDLTNAIVSCPNGIKSFV